MQEKEEFEIDLIELVKFCWKKKLYFIVPLVIASVIVVAYSFITIKMDPKKSPLPNQYTSVEKILVRESSSKTSISSSVSSLASLAGVNLGSSGGTSNGTLVTTIAETNAFKDSIIEKFNLIEKYKIEKKVKTNSRKALSGSLKVALDDKTSILSVSFKDIDPVFAQQVASYASDLLIEMFYKFSAEDDSVNLQNYTEAMEASFAKIVQYQKDVQELEQSTSNVAATSIPSIMFEAQMKKLELEAEQTIYSQFRAQKELLEIQMENELTTLRVLQEAEVPEEKSGPSRAKMCIIVDLVVFFVTFVYVFVCFYREQLKKFREKGEVVAK